MVVLVILVVVVLEVVPLMGNVPLGPYTRPSREQAASPAVALD